MSFKGLFENLSAFKVLNFSIVLGLIIIFSIIPSSSLNILYTIRVGQITVFSCCIIVIGILQLAELMLTRGSRFEITISDAILIVFVLYIVLERCFVYNGSGFSLRLIELLGLIVLYLILRINVTNYAYFFYACVFGCIIQSIYGLSQLYSFFPSNNNHFSITGSFFNPGPLAGYILYGLCTSIALYLYRHNSSDQLKIESFLLTKKTLNTLYSYFCFIGMIACLLVLCACKSRASWLGLIVCISLLFYKNRYKDLSQKLNSRFKIVAITISAIIIIATIILLYFINQNSSDGRLLVWKIAAEIVLKNPILGVGFDNFSANYMSFQKKYFEMNPFSTYRFVAGDIKYPFNILMVYLSENGIIGAILLIFISCRIFLVKETDPITIVSKVTLLAQIIFALFSYSEQILPIKLNIVCSLALLASKDVTFFSFNIGKSISKAVKYTLAFTFIICSFFSIIYIKRMVNSFKNWETGFQVYSNGQYLEAIPFFDSAYPVLKGDGEFLMQYGNTLLKAEKFMPALRIFQDAEEYFNNYPLQISIGNCYRKLKNPDSAINSYTNASSMVPSRLYPKYLQANYFLELNKKEYAIKIAKIILLSDIKIKSDATDEIKAKMGKIVTNQFLSSQEILSIVNRTSNIPVNGI